MMKSRFILSNEKNLGERRKGSRYHATRTLILAPGGRATPSQSLVPLWGLFPRVERPTAGRGPHRSPGAAWPAEAGRAGALTLSSWATWAFCRYTEYRKAVTTELVPRRMNWPSEGRPPLSMAAPSQPELASSQGAARVGEPSPLGPRVDTRQRDGAPWEGKAKLVPGEKARAASGCPSAGMMQATHSLEHRDNRGPAPFRELPCELTH